MTPSLVTALVWLVAANVIGLFPSKHKHWPSAYFLIAIGLPLLAWLAYENGALITFGVFLAAASILRWPVLFFIRWIASLFGTRAEG